MQTAYICTQLVFKFQRSTFIHFIVISELINFRDKNVRFLSVLGLLNHDHVIRVPKITLHDAFNYHLVISEIQLSMFYSLLALSKPINFDAQLSKWLSKNKALTRARSFNNNNSVVRIVLMLKQSRHSLFQNYIGNIFIALKRLKQGM